jgi:hypothetical protein
MAGVNSKGSRENVLELANGRPLMSGINNMLNTDPSSFRKESEQQGGNIGP